MNTGASNTVDKHPVVESSLECSDDDVEDSAIADNEQTNTCNESPESVLSTREKLVGSLVKFYKVYDFPIHIIVAIVLARAYPPLGAEYFKPDITATWIAVGIIFVLAGIGLKTEEYSQAIKRIGFNAYVQAYNFLFVSSVVFAVSRALVAANMLDPALGDGMVIGGCLPMAVNVVLVLTAAVGGDEAVAVFNTAFGNILGIFLSPVLILMYLGDTGNISLGEVVYKLTLRIVVPLVIGQMLQKLVPPAYEFYQQHRGFFKKFQEFCLVFIVYTVFCKTFQSDSKSSPGSVLLMIIYQLFLMLFLMAIAWYSLRFIFRDQPRLHGMGVFGCVQKTVALGIPLIASMYDNDPNQALYTLPILIWHPMQLVVGSMLVPRISRYVTTELQRLKESEDDQNTTIVGDVEAQSSESDTAHVKSPKEASLGAD